MIIRYVPPITTAGDAQGGSVALPESPDAIEEEIKKQESLLAGTKSSVNLNHFVLKQFGGFLKTFLLFLVKHAKTWKYFVLNVSIR